MICPVELASDLSAWRAARVGGHARHGKHSKAATERAMKVQEVIWRAVAKRITWWQAMGAGFSLLVSDIPENLGVTGAAGFGFGNSDSYHLESMLRMLIANSQPDRRRQSSRQPSGTLCVGSYHATYGRCLCCLVAEAKTPAADLRNRKAAGDRVVSACGSIGSAVL
jgi:hypothetical protein